MEMIQKLQLAGVMIFGTNNLVDSSSVGYHGDSNTRVKGVYTFASGTETAWFKAL